MATDTLTEFVKALRGAGVPVSTAETLDAVRVTEQLGYVDRGRLKAGLSLALAKTEQDKLRFAQCFDDFFAFARPRETANTPPAAEPPQGGSGESDGGGAGGGMQGVTSELGQMLAQGDEAQLSARMAQAATEGDELVIARCDLDLGKSYKNSTFNFAKHREPQTYGMIVERKGAVVA